MSDSDNEDQDYNPEEEPMEEDEPLLEDTQPVATSLSSMQVKKVDEAFEELFGYKWGSSFELPKSLTPQQRLLTSILGPSRTASLLRIGAPKPKVYRKPERIKHTYKNVQPRKEAKESNTSVASFSQKSGVDQVLENLEKPSQVSTIQKTSTDWDRFKDQTGLGEKLESQADSKTAYLKKQDFLTRVDHRTFEKERDERSRTKRPPK